MATCKDCMHYDLCRSCSRIQLGWNVNTVGYVENVEEICKHFADSSRFVELPCKLRDTLFVPTRNFVSEYKIVSFHVCGEGIWYRTNVIKGILTRLISDNVENIGKTVFLTREEAEQALKEREENG